MKPIELRFKNLRSYRDDGAARVNFNGTRLLGILGDTGAGKSSVIEALVAALYSATTWDGKNVAALIADGAKEMHVELDFEAGGRNWRVTRGIKAKGASVHCLEEIGTTNRWDGARDVNPQIEKLVGLSYKQFLQAVVLPQGRFDTLLKASPSERAKALESILGMEHLRQVRDQAIAATAALRPAHAKISERRQRMLPDPAATARDLTAQVERLQTRLSQLQAAAAAVQQAERDAETAVAEEKRFGALADALTRPGLDDAVARISDLARLDEEHSRILEPLDTRAKETKTRRDSLEGKVRVAEEAGRGPTALGRVEVALSGLSANLERLEHDHGRLAIAERELADLDKAAADAATDLQKAVEAEKDAEAEHKRLGEEATTAAQAADGAARLLGAARQAATAVSNAAGKVETLDRHYTASAEHAEAARAEAITVSERADTAEDALRAAQRSDAAACAAEGLEPGEPCPVCTQPLPDEFHAPAAADLATAERSAKQARKDAAEAERAASKAEAERDAAKRALTEANADLNLLRRQATDARRAAEAVIGPVDLAGGDAAMLSPVLAEAAAAGKAAAAAATGHQQRTAARAEAHGAANQTSTTATKARATVGKDRERVLEARAGLERSVESLPGDLRPVLPLTSEAISAARDHLSLETGRAQQLVNEARAAVDEHQRSVDALNDAQHRRHNEVESAVPEVRVKLEAWAERITSATEAAGLVGPTGSLGPAGTTGELAVWAVGLPELAARAAAKCRSRAETAHAAVAVAVTHRDEALAGVGCVTGDQLNQEIGADKARAKAARDELAEAQRQAPLAEQLEAALAESGPLLEALDEVTDLLSPAKFPKWVIERRQRKLLELAADRLAEMTGDRLRFAEDFRIWDRRTDMTRDPATLSGGESFMASLALALTLVEMSAGSSEPQGALFLDEGFAALDADCLSEAMTVLDTQTAGGRVVAIITHLRAAAEYVDQVLWAEKGAASSTLTLLTPEEVERLLANDAASGLVA